MSREEEPSFVISDRINVKESTNCTSLLHCCNGRWLVGLAVIAIEFGLRPTDLHPHKVDIFLTYYHSLLEQADGANIAMPSA